MGRVGYLDPDIDVERAVFKFIRIIFEGEAIFYFFDNCYFEFDAIRECVCFYPIKM